MADDDVELEEDDEDLELDDHINITINSRNHIRELSKILAPVDGLILTGTFGLLYFILNSSINSNNGKGLPIDPRVIELLLITSVIVAGSIVSSILSVTVKAGKPLLTKIQYMDDLHDIYKGEFDWAWFSVTLLGFGMVVFIIAMILFSMDYLTRVTTSP